MCNPTNHVSRGFVACVLRPYIIRNCTLKTLKKILCKYLCWPDLSSEKTGQNYSIRRSACTLWHIVRTSVYLSRMSASENSIMLCFLCKYIYIIQVGRLVWWTFSNLQYYNSINYTQYTLILLSLLLLLYLLLLYNINQCRNSLLRCSLFPNSHIFQSHRLRSKSHLAVTVLLVKCVWK